MISRFPESPSIHYMTHGKSCGDLFWLKLLKLAVYGGPSDLSLFSSNESPFQCPDDWLLKDKVEFAAKMAWWCLFGKVGLIIK